MPSRPHKSTPSRPQVDPQADPCLPSHAGGSIHSASPSCAFLRGNDEQNKDFLQLNRVYLQKLAKLESIEWLSPGDATPACATGLHNNVEVLVPLAGLIDVSAETARLEKEIGKLEAGLKSVSVKLSNEKFISKAPDAVVAKERAKQEEMLTALTALRSKLDELNNL